MARFLAALLVFGAASAAALAAGGVATRVDAWYEGLAKPAATPPGAAIGAAWWTIFALLAVAMAIAWTRGGPEGRGRLAAVYGANLVLNVLWSVLFFRARLPGAALADLVVLEASVVALAVLAGRRSRTAAALLVPYALWVAFAGYLNLEIWRLNP